MNYPSIPFVILVDIGFFLVWSILAYLFQWDHVGYIAKAFLVSLVLIVPVSILIDKWFNS